MALLLTKCGQRARAEAVSHGSLGGGVAAVEKRRGRAGVGYGDGGAAGARRLCSRVLRTAKEEQRKCKMERGLGRASTGGVKAALWLVTAALGRMPATRGQFPRHAAASA